MATFETLGQTTQAKSIHTRLDCDYILAAAGARKLLPPKCPPVLAMKWLM